MNDDNQLSYDDILTNIYFRQYRPLGRNRISFIKTFRAATGEGLKESKDAVEDFLIRRACLIGGKHDMVAQADALLRDIEPTEETR